MIFVQDNFISNGECFFILNNILEEYWQKIPNDSLWDKRIINLHSTNKNKQLHDLLYSIFLKKKRNNTKILFFTK